MTAAFVMKTGLNYFLMGVVALALSRSAAAPAAEEAVSPSKKPQVVRVGIYILNLGKFDVGSGAYTVDFYMSLKSDEPIEKDSFEFMNGRAASRELIEDKPTEKFYRIQANLFQNVNLKNYPFDRHTLTIEIEEKNNDLRKVVYEPDETMCGVDEYVTFVGWELEGQPRIRAPVHDYPLFGERYSRLVFEINIRRSALAAILKAFVPIAFILFVGLLSLLIATDKVAMRFGLNTSMLLAAVMFHLNVTSSLPPLAYLTFADKFMFGSYISLALCLGSTLLLMRHTDKGEEAAARRIFRLSLILVPIITVALFVLLFLNSGVF
jgi:hypothetical protein